MIPTTLLLGPVSAALRFAAFLASPFFFSSISFSRLEVEYRAWTEDGKLWHASYKGSREQDNAAVSEVEK